MIWCGRTFHGPRTDAPSGTRKLSTRKEQAYVGYHETPAIKVGTQTALREVMKVIYFHSVFLTNDGTGCSFFTPVLLPSYKTKF
jgi:hypothetical protein